jgi:two-component system, OmpR family, phosphate regulon sensor histidine kinase PhoR
MPEVPRVLLSERRLPSQRRRLFVALLVLLVLAVIAGDWFLSSRLTREVVERTTADLMVRSALVDDALRQPLKPLARVDGETSASPLDVKKLDEAVTEAARHSAARVTVVAAGGAVLADSEVPLADVASLPSHAERIEIKTAAAIGVGTTIRRSPTLQTPMVYVARRVDRPGHDPVVVRVAVPLSALEGVAEESRRRLIFALCGAALLAFLLASLSAEVTASPLEGALQDLDASLSHSVEEVREQRDRVNGILEAMDEGVLLLDERGEILLMNPALRAMLSSTTNGRAKRDDRGAIAPFAEILAEAKGAEKSLVRELTLAGPQRRQLLVRATARVEPSSVLLVVVDVSERRRLEAVRRDFVTNASHELRTPISSIVSAAETLQGGALDDHTMAVRFTDIILRNADRMRRLVDDLLELSRVESRVVPMVCEPGDVVEFIAHVADLFRARAEARGIAVVIEGASAGDSSTVTSAAPIASFDERALEGVLSNLLDNAIKYCPSGAQVRVACQAQPADGTVRVSITDDGGGIPAEHLPRIFERFYRIDRGRARDVGGTGLGLAIVKHQVEAMGGAVKVESVVGEGTTFSFTLPLADAHVSPSKRP